MRTEVKLTERDKKFSYPALVPAGIECEDNKIFFNKRYSIYRRNIGDTTWFVKIHEEGLSLDTIKALIVRDHMQMYIDAECVDLSKFQDLLDHVYNLQLRELR